MSFSLARAFPWDHELVLNNDNVSSREAGSNLSPLVCLCPEEVILDAGGFSEVILSNELRLRAKQRKKGTELYSAIS